MRNVTGSQCLSETATAVYIAGTAPYMCSHMRAGRPRTTVIRAARPCAYMNVYVDSVGSRRILGK